MKKSRKAKICDDILDKFRGNKSFNWNELHQESFFRSIDEDYFVMENLLNHLLGDGVKELEEYEFNGTIYIRLSKKGFYTISDLENEGYVSKWRKEKREKIWKYFLGAITISTFLVVGFRFYRDFLNSKSAAALPINQTKTVPVNPNAGLKATP